MTIVRELLAASSPRPIGSVSVSEAEQLLTCRLRVVFNNDPVLRSMQPTSAPALLGTAAHNAIASMSNAARDANQEAAPAPTRLVAQLAFDDALRALCERRDEQIAARGTLPGECIETADRLPFYAITRSRFSRVARNRFGEQWRWKKPVPSRSRGREREPPELLGIGAHAEVPLHSQDGRLRGIADEIVVSAHGIEIEEFKTGELTPERLPGWTLQLVLYAHLLEERYQVRPSRLRIRCISGDTHEIPCDIRAARDEAARVLGELARLNEQIATGARAADLAAPSRAACARCAHRPWCGSYWATSSARSDNDVDGVVVSVTGWRAFIATSSETAVVDFRWYGSLPLAGARIRICDAKRESNGMVVPERSSSVWSLP
jgi:RecB family exonuclease